MELEPGGVCHLLGWFDGVAKKMDQEGEDGQADKTWVVGFPL